MVRDDKRQKETNRCLALALLPLSQFDMPLHLVSHSRKTVGQRSRTKPFLFLVTGAEPRAREWGGWQV